MHSLSTFCHPLQLRQVLPQISAPILLQRGSVNNWRMQVNKMLFSAPRPVAFEALSCSSPLLVCGSLDEQGA